MPIQIRYCLLVAQSFLKSLFLLLLFFSCLSTQVLAGEIVLADFEQEDYGDWTATGNAFGERPANGTLPNQMHVSRYLGSGLVNSFNGGDNSTGTLTSPQFEISKRYLNFLVGGGGWDDTAVTLTIDGKEVMKSVGPNTKPGGAENLSWTCWDLKPHLGKTARIVVVDQHQGGWGHILADQFTLSDQPKLAQQISRKINIEGEYLHFPVKNGAPKVWVRLVRGDQEIRRFEIELVDRDPSFVVAADVSQWIGDNLDVVIDQTFEDPSILNSVVSSNELPSSEQIYKEEVRPAFHFTSKIGWLNDPNGLVYHKGQWHLFYQHNPFGWNWGNMHWGHASSSDLITWTEKGDKIHPWSDAEGAAFSGSGLIDFNNSSGLKTGSESLLVFPFTDTAIGEALAYSNDGGETLEIYRGNPVVKHQGRDPKVIWHEPSSRWVMAVYDESDGKQWIAFYTSANLIDWEYQSRIEGFYECPDLFELPIRGTENQRGWVLYAADGRYVVGDFDGKIFVPRHDGKHQVWYGDFYAAQTYSDAPSDRRVQIGWGRGVQFPGQRFNQQMVVPVDLRLRKTKAGTRMFAEPVIELNAYAVPEKQLDGLELNGHRTELTSLMAPFRFDLQLELGPESIATLDIGGARIAIDRTKGEVRVAEIAAACDLSPKSVALTVLVDRGSIEVFVNNGEIAVSKAWLYGRKNVVITGSAENDARVVTGIVSRLTADRK